MLLDSSNVFCIGRRIQAAAGCGSGTAASACCRAGSQPSGASPGAKTSVYRSCSRQALAV